VPSFSAFWSQWLSTKLWTQFEEFEHMKMKVSALLLSVAAIAFQFGNCSAFLGDLVGDAIFLRGID
jgi:hypothetical protein